MQTSNPVEVEAVYVFTAVPSPSALIPFSLSLLLPSPVEPAPVQDLPGDPVPARRGVHRARAAQGRRGGGSKKGKPARSIHCSA